MLKSHEKFHSVNGKRLVLVADDELINRELLGVILENDYEVIYASDGRETMDQIEAHKDILSLVLLDLKMPVMSGIEVLKAMKAAPDLTHIPVIVLTADQNAEIESLSIGAADFIPKPYPQPGIILARVIRTIELSEDREIIQSTERDPLTGLYNREYFYRYAEQYDNHHKDVEMDAIVVDINHFHMINERFGNAYGDEVLKRISERLRESVADVEGIVCRREADTFMVYCPHGKKYKDILENAAIGLVNDEDTVNSRVRLRLGVYTNVDKSLEVERRFDRAKMAADTVRNSFTRTIGMYDNAMHERELYIEQLIDDFHTAILEKQFKVYFQPKYDVRPKSPVLTSAEALVRWMHPTLGMISPGVFIPLFEDNGLIQDLDNYIWRETTAQIRAWKDTLGFSVPISVNVSRIDMYDPLFIDKMKQLLEEYRLEPSDLLLEITESAYTESSEQIIDTVNRLRALGFKIEMDDFGTGYSSLNMISALPIDALKLDMQFVHSAFRSQKDTRMLKLIIDIAKHLSVPVIAEGVETEEQLRALKDLGCDIVQGYFFSRPVPADQLTPLLIERRGISEEALIPSVTIRSAGTDEPAFTNKPTRKTLNLRFVNVFFVIMAFIITASLIITDQFITRGYLETDQASERYVSAQLSAMNLEIGSDYLTGAVRSFVFTGNFQYMNDFFTETKVTRRRDKAVEDLEKLLGGTDSDAYKSLSEALGYSNQLVDWELRAMRLIQIANGYQDSEMPSEVTSVHLDAEDLAKSPEALRAEAMDLVCGDAYSSYKTLIRENVHESTEALIDASEGSLLQAEKHMRFLLNLQTTLTILLALAVLAEVIFVTRGVRVPLTRMVKHMRAQQPIPPNGVEELRFVTQTYNEILKENHRKQEQLSYEALHDVLTGLYNRSAYEMFINNIDKSHIALLIIDVDKFKSVNDTYGHDMGDRVLKRVSELLMANFRSVDIVCRLGGDEFVVIMTRVNSSLNQLVISKIEHMNQLLQNPQDDLPPVSLSVGAAFSDRRGGTDNIFKDADTALYRIKNGARGGCAIYGSEEPGGNA